MLEAQTLATLDLSRVLKSILNINRSHLITQLQKLIQLRMQFQFHCIVKNEVEMVVGGCFQFVTLVIKKPRHMAPNNCNPYCRCEASVIASWN